MIFAVVAISGCVFSQVICDHMNIPWEIIQVVKAVLAVAQLVIPA